MKKLSWILIITLLASCLSACGRKETVIYQGDTASTSDATDDPIRNLDYTKNLIPICIFLHGIT